MQQAIQVERDMEGTQQACRGLFEEAFHRACLDGSALAADKETRLRALDDIADRKLSPGYYRRAAYLIDLKQTIETGVWIAARELAHTDVAGQQCVARAKNAFERAHPACGRCGTRQDNDVAFKCRNCGMKFSRGDN